MKKTLALFTAFLIIVISLTAVAANKIYTKGCTVEMLLTEEAGDRSLLSDVCVDMEISHSGMMNWNISFEPFSEVSASLDFKKTEKRNYGYNNYGVDAWYFESLDLAYISDNIKQAKDNLKSRLINTGDRETLQIKMADHFDYYPIKPDLHLPDFSIYYSYSGIDDKAGFSFDGISSERGLGFIEKLQDYIKIPPHSEDIRKETIEKIEQGYSYSTNTVNTFNFSFQNALFSDKLYFAFDNRIYPTDNRVDTSEITGGYGIYSVPYTENDVLYEQMKTEYRVNADSNIVYLDGDTENDLLYLCLIENSSFIFRVIDRKTMSDIASLELFSYKEGDTVHYEIFDDFFVFHKNNYELKVVKKTDSSYEEAFSYTVPEENNFRWEYFPYKSSCAFDGERLIIFTPEREYHYDSPHFSLTQEIIVLTEKGLGYYGKWQNSLGETVMYNSGYFNRLDSYKVKLLPS